MEVIPFTIKIASLKEKNSLTYNMAKILLLSKY